jgi:hypothetical protein
MESPDPSDARYPLRQKAAGDACKPFSQKKHELANQPSPKD